MASRRVRRLIQGTVAVSAAAGLLFAGRLSNAQTVTYRDAVRPVQTTLQIERAIRESADAFVGALYADDAVGACAVMSHTQRMYAANDQGTCENAAHSYSMSFTTDTATVDRVVLVSPVRAIVYATVGSVDVIYRYVTEHGRWVMDGAHYAPKS